MRRRAAARCWCLVGGRRGGGGSDSPSWAGAVASSMRASILAQTFQPCVPRSSATSAARRGRSLPSSTWREAMSARTWPTSHRRTWQPPPAPRCGGRCTCTAPPSPQESGRPLYTLAPSPPSMREQALAATPARMPFSLGSLAGSTTRRGLRLARSSGPRGVALASHRGTRRWAWQAGSRRSPSSRDWPFFAGSSRRNATVCAACWLASSRLTPSWAASSLTGLWG
mmetsp:Transcript_24253/g.77851  ORF Transcript_24253/g.77851 Transcript_24253/m.77851 type:complete len:226 (+) Transcript_24253:98-775(+)